jgi:arylsulfatase A-like enzyme/Flp pilus assembly protein TadD
VLAAIGAAVVWWRQAAPRHRPNLLLVTIDTLRADHVGAYGHAAARTPVLDGLARRGARFARAQAAVPLTGPSHATILTGLYPPVHGVRDNVTFTLDASHPTLATLLKATGYDTAAFIGAYPLASDFGFGHGFDVFDQALHPSALGSQGAERPANEVADAAVRWLAARRNRPFFAWVHFYDPHAPYAPPPPFDQAFPEQPYDGEIAFTDTQLGRVLDALRPGHANDTLVAVAGDHGEGLGEHGEAEHGVLMYESTLRVPLLLAGPGLPAGAVVQAPVGLAELLPTLLGLLGVPAPQGLPGRDLGPAMRGTPFPADALYAETLFGRLACRWATLRGLTEGDWKLIRGARTELFNLADDPGETRDRSQEEAPRAARLAEKLSAAVARMAPGGDHARSVPITAEQEERLRSLGYTGGGGGGGALDDASLPDPSGRAPVFDRLQKASLARSGEAVARATEEVRVIAAGDPGNPYAQFILATLAYQQGDFRLAEQAYARTIELDPDRTGTRGNFAKLLRQTGKLAEAERHYRIAVAQAPDDIEAQVGLADTLTLAARLDEADALLEAVLSREPRHTDAHRALGRLFLARGRPKDAVAEFEQGTGGRDPDGWIELAVAQLAARDRAGARASSDQALAQNAAHPWALAVAGHLLALDGRRGDALALLQRALKVRPRRAEVWRALARGFEAAGDPAAAKQCRREAER